MFVERYVWMDVLFYYHYMCMHGVCGVCDGTWKWCSIWRQRVFFTQCVLCVDSSTLFFCFLLFFFMGAQTLCMRVVRFILVSYVYSFHAYIFIFKPHLRHASSMCVPFDLSILSDMLACCAHAWNGC